MRTWTTWGFFTAAAMAALMIACGGSSTSPSPNPTPSPTPTPAPGGTTITITAAGVNPKSITVAPGTQVTFVNNDIRNHTMNSDPHPEHTDCEEINQVGFLAPGQSRNTGNLNNRKTCRYHDHELSSQTQLQGMIVIQ